MKKKALSIFLAICLITLTAFATTPDLSQHPDFEDGEPGQVASPGTTGPDTEQNQAPEQPATPGTTAQAIGIQPLALAVSKQLSAVAVGDTVKINVNGSAYEFIVVQHGKPSSIYDDSFNNGVWLLMKDIYENRQWHSSRDVYYISSTIHSYLNNTFLNLLEQNIRNAISQVKVPYRTDGGGNFVNSGESGLAAKVFLLSIHEVNRELGKADGAPLSYFVGTAGVDAKRIAYLSGTAAIWWLRTPSASDSANYITALGGSGGQYVDQSWGIRPALVVPNTLYVDSSGFLAVDSAPTAPSSITVPSSILYNSAYTVSWGTSTSSTGTLAGYRLERQINSGTWTQIYQGTATSYSQTLTRNQANTVNYRVKAYSTGGLESGYTTGTARTVTNNREPTTPPSFSAQPAGAVNSWQTAALTWTWNASTDADSDTINYVVESSLNGGAFSVVQNSTARTYTHNISIPDHNYIQIRIRTYDGTAYSASYLTSSTVSITHDTVAPTIQVTAVPDATTIWAKDEITITVIVADALSGLKSLTVPAGVTPTGNQTLSGMSETKTFKASANQTYSFTVTDNAGKSASDSVSPSKIDRDDPVIEYETVPPAGEFTNGDVTINLTMSDASSGLANLMSLNGSEALSGNLAQRSFTVTSNNIFPFSLTDLVGHIKSLNVQVNQIDRVKPVAQIVPRVKQWTNAGSVVLDVTGTDDYSGVASLMLPDAAVITGAAGTYEIFNNGEYTATATDRASNISDAAALSYAWFDRTKPTVKFVEFVDTGNPVINFFANLFGQTITNKHVKIEVTAEDIPTGSEGESGVTHMFYRVFNQAGELVQDWTSSPISAAPVVAYDVNGSVEVYVRDAAANDSDIEAHDIIIDTAPPEIEVTYSTTEVTNDPVEVTLRIISDDGSASKGWTLPEGGVFVPQSEITYTFAENAVKTFIAFDTAGNRREVELQISNIENLKVPVELWENNQVVIDAVQHATGRRYIEDVTYNDLLKITFIDLSSNYMDSIPGVFGEISNLEHLDLRGNEFTEVPECVYRLTKLKYLFLSNNNLTFIGDEIRSLTQLETFDVSLNYLVDYDCPLIISNYLNVGNFTSSGQSNQYAFSVADAHGADELIGNTVQINVNWFFDGQQIDRLEDHRKTLYMGLYPQYRTYRPLLFRYEVQNGEIKAATPDYAQIFLSNTGVMEATLKLAG